MFGLIARFFTDESYFADVMKGAAGSRWVRGALLAATAAVLSGSIPLGLSPTWMHLVAVVLGGAAGTVAVGERNVPLDDVKKALGEKSGE